MAISSGRLTRVYAKKETVYGAPPALAVGDYVLTTGGSGSTHDPFSYSPSPERTPSNSLMDSIRGRSTTSVALSGVVRGSPAGGAPSLDAFWEGLFGATPIDVDAVADTTDAANVGRVMGVVDADADGNGLLVPVIGATGGAAATVAVAGTPAYASRNYNLARQDAPIPSLTVREQMSGGAGAAPSKITYGWCVDTATIRIDGTGAATVDFSGPAADADLGAAAGADVPLPDTFEEALIPLGITANAWFYNHSAAAPAWSPLARRFRSVSVTITNNYRLVNDVAGISTADDLYRGDDRAVSVELMAHAETAHAMWAALQAAIGSGPYFGLIVSWGTVAGSRACLHLPRVRFTPPPVASDAEMIPFNFAGVAHGTGAGDNEIALLLG